MFVKKEGMKEHYHFYFKLDISTFVRMFLTEAETSIIENDTDKTGCSPNPESW